MNPIVKTSENRFHLQRILDRTCAVPLEYNQFVFDNLDGTVSKANALTDNTKKIYFTYSGQDQAVSNSLLDGKLELVDTTSLPSGSLSFVQYSCETANDFTTADLNKSFGFSADGKYFDKANVTPVAILKRIEPRTLADGFQRCYFEFVK
ncbi:MAG: hypothetical protein E6R13_02630 [Spirochaetes bacterium]|nr:MAG: hypothetical protein E6R13_02630 [Spirochaetota bacterium]